MQKYIYTTEVISQSMFTELFHSLIPITLLLSITTNQQCLVSQSCPGCWLNGYRYPSGATVGNLYCACDHWEPLSY